MDLEESYIVNIFSKGNFEDKTSHLKPKNLSKLVNWLKYNTFSSTHYYFRDTNKWLGTVEKCAFATWKHICKHKTITKHRQENS